MPNNIIDHSDNYITTQFVDESDTEESLERPFSYKLRFILRLILWPITLFILLLLITISGLIVLLNNEHTLPYLINIAQEVAPGELHINNYQGRLTDSVTIHGLRYEADGLELNIGKFHLAWHPLALSYLQLDILDLQLDQVRLTLPPAAPATEPSPAFAGIVLPLDIDLKRLLLTNLWLNLPDAKQPLYLKRFAASIQASGTRVKIKQLDVDALGATAQVQGRMRLEPAIPMRLQVNWGYKVPNSLNIAGFGTIQGNLKNLDLDQTITAPLAVNIAATLQNLEQTPQWDAKLTVTNLNFTSLVPQLPGHSVTGYLRSTGNLDNIMLTSDLKLALENLGKFTIKLNSNYNGKTFTARHVAVTTSNGAKIIIMGQYIPNTDLGRFAGQINWHNLRWPLHGKPIVAQSQTGQLSINGTPSAYTYQLATAVTMPT
ncbi:hypothetical protein TI05_11585, partial [Achromatium sp. WMS3]